MVRVRSILQRWQLLESSKASRDFSAITSGSKLQAALSRISFPQTSNYSLRLSCKQHFSMNAFVHLSSAQSLIIRSQALYLPFAASRLVPFHTAVRARKMSSTTKLEEKFAPARRVAGQKQDVWYVKTLAHMSVEVVLTLATKVNR